LPDNPAVAIAIVVEHALPSDNWISPPTTITSPHSEA